MKSPALKHLYTTYPDQPRRIERHTEPFYAPVDDESLATGRYSTNREDAILICVLVFIVAVEGLAIWAVYGFRYAPSAAR